MTRVDTRPISIRTQIVELKADPRRARQFEGPLALFWEPETARAEGRPREGLACTFSVCRAPSCPCREVPVRVTGIDDGIYGLQAIEDRPAIVYEPGKARPDELSTEEALRLARELCELGTRRVTLAGGEPILREDWPLIAEAMTSRGVKDFKTQRALLPEHQRKQREQRRLRGR